MSLPTLTPASTLSAIVLPVTGNLSNVNSAVPYKIYSNESAPMYSGEFISGAVDQVSYVYKKLGGDVLDIELTEGNVYAAYEEAVLEYCYLINVHQATNIISDSLGNTTGSFDSKGNIMAGALSSSLSGSHVTLKYPKFDYGISRRVAEGVSADVGLKNSVQFSASFDITTGKQDYDLQTIISSNTNTTASATVTISNHANLTAGDTVVFSTTDGTTITATANETTTTSTDTNSPTFDVGDGSNNATATNLATCLNANSKITATASENVVTIKQVVPGGTGNGEITLTDSGDAGMTKADFTGGNTIPYVNSLKNKKLLVKKVYYKTPHAMWRFFGYYGGLNVVGNLHNYGQFSDDSTFQLIPAWHNKAQAMAFEDAIYTRMSHYSYELRDNKLRLFPIPYTGGPTKMFVEFSIPEDSWESDDPKSDGVNNMNTLPIGNIPFVNINAIGKQWIRRFALALCKETLGQVRSKFGNVPIPGETVTLNGTALISEGKDEQEKLRTELKETLAELTYLKLTERDSTMLENAEKGLTKVPYHIYVG
tara:strand:- start:512 stop:2131 length:1620 start_codon:yes stop_codon:yes gene_type:complete